MTETGRRSSRAGAFANGNRRTGIASKVIGVIYLAIALGAVVFAIVTWLIGRLNPVSALVFALVAAGTAPIGLLALRNEYPDSRRMDEGQREMDREAKSDAFHVAYFGLFALFYGAIFFPGFRDAMPIAVGLLLLLVMLVWMLGYMWRRWRP